jgi:spermidine synthase
LLPEGRAEVSGGKGSGDAVGGRVCGVVLIVLTRLGTRGKGGSSVAGLAALAMLVLASTGSWADNSLFDESVRSEMLKHRDGRIARIETEYNTLFITKRSAFLTLSTRFKADYVESIVNLKDPDDLPAEYARIMSVGLVYPEATKRILMIGLGAGSISTYLGRALPDVQIDVVELDPGLVAASKKYFGLQATDRVRILESDGRIYLNRHKELYDLILLDAYRELGVPFHLLTREFYTLLKERLAPSGAVVSNILGGTKLYVSTLVTLSATFPTVDVYPEYEIGDEVHGIVVATPTPAPSMETLTRRAVALQGQHHFRYPLPGLVTKRVANPNAANGELLTDDFSPVSLYEIIPVRPRRRQ